MSADLLAAGERLRALVVDEWEGPYGLIGAGAEAIAAWDAATQNVPGPGDPQGEGGKPGPGAQTGGITFHEAQGERVVLLRTEVGTVILAGTNGGGEAIDAALRVHATLDGGDLLIDVTTAQVRHVTIDERRLAR